MKTRKNLFFPTALGLGLSLTLHAAPLAWTGGNGTWQVGDAGQWGSPWANGDTATFNGPGGAVTLGGAITTGNAALAFTSGNFTFSAAAPLAITLGNTNLNLGAVATTIGTNVTLNRDTWIIDGATTATSTMNFTGGTLSGAAGNTTIREATVTVGSGSTLRSPGSLICGLGTDGAALTVSGGTVAIDGTGTSLILNNGAVTASVTMTISGGAISFLNGGNTNGIRFGGNAGGNTTGIFNLDGGIVTVNKVFEAAGTVNSTFNFNGGTLRARRSNTDFMTGLDNAVVKSGGAFIDTNGQNVTLGQALTPGSPVGGLTKIGPGNLTLSGASTYTGATSVTGGRLNIGGSLVSAVSVSSGATLGGEGSVSSSPSFAPSGSTFAFDPATPGAFTAASLSLGSSVIQLASDAAMTNGTTYLVMTNSTGFSGSPQTNFRAPSRGILAYSGNSLNFTPSASAAVKWKGDSANPSFWDTEITANWDNSGTPDSFFNLDAVLFDDTASTYSVAIQGGSVKPASVSFNHSATYTLSGGAIEGTLGITKDGSGTVILGNSNTYTGATLINAGTVQVNGGSAISDAGLVTLSNTAGATFGVLGSETIGAISGGGTSGGVITINSAQTLSLGNGTQTYSGTVTGSGALTNAGAIQTLTGVVSNSGGLNVTSGRLTLDAENTYTGTTSVSANSGVIVSKVNGLGATGASNGTTVLGSGDAASGQIGLSGGLSFPAEKIVGSGNGHVSPASVNGFTAQQRGILQSVSGNNTFAGDIEINSAGTTRLGTQDGASLTLSGNITRSVGVTGVTLLFRVGNTGGDFLTLSGAGNDFDECSLFSASTTSNTGVRLGVDDSLPVQALLKAANGSPILTTLDLDGYEQTIGGITADPNSGGLFKIINRNLANPSTLTLANTQNTASSLAAISNDGGAGGVINIVKTGSFTQGLGAANTYTGTTNIQGGRLDFLKRVALYNNTPASWTPANISVEAGATLGLAVCENGEFTGSDVETLITNLTTSNGNGLKAGSSLFLNAMADTVVTTPLANTTGSTGGTISLEKGGAFKLTLSGSNSYSGNTTVSLGTLQLNTSNAANNTSTVSIAATDAFLELNFDESGGAVTDTVGSLFIGGVQKSAGVYKATNNLTDSGIHIPQITGQGTLTVLTGPAGFEAWQNANNTTTGIDGDHDQDGVANGIEFFLTGPVDSTGFTSLPSVVPAGNSISITWVKATGYNGAYGTHYLVETSPTLSTPWTQAPEGTGSGTVEITGNTVKYTFPNPLGTKSFARLKVTGP